MTARVMWEKAMKTAYACMHLYEYLQTYVFISNFCEVKLAHVTSVLGETCNHHYFVHEEYSFFLLHARYWWGKGVPTPCKSLKWRSFFSTIHLKNKTTPKAVAITSHLFTICSICSAHKSCIMGHCGWGSPHVDTLMTAAASQVIFCLVSTRSK